jgi:hypothetical protein
MSLYYLLNEVEIDRFGDFTKTVKVDSKKSRYMADIAHLAYWTEEQMLKLQDREFIQNIKNRLDKIFPKEKIVLLFSNVEAHDPTFDYVTRKLDRGALFGIGEWFSKSVKINSFIIPRIDKALYKAIRKLQKQGNSVIVVRSVINGDLFPYFDLTEWAVIHKVAHGLNGISDIGGASDRLLGRLCYILKECYGIEIPDDLYYARPEYENALADFFTFKSAREKNLFGTSEMMNEILTQFLYTGRVKMNVHAPSSINGHELLVRPELVHKHLKDLEKRYNDYFGNRMRKSISGQIMMV